MREIKFRAWNVATKTMVDLKKITPLALDIDTDGLFIPFSNGLLLMQFTGLKDKTGKEIYEGDIVKLNDRFIDIVVFEASQFCTKEPQATNVLSEWGGIEVLGNIYENPELLAERKLK